MVTFRVVVHKATTEGPKVVEIFETTTARLDEHEAWGVAIDWLVDRQLESDEQATITRLTSGQ